MLRALILISLLMVGFLLVFNERFLLYTYFIPTNVDQNSKSINHSITEKENRDFYALFSTEILKLKTHSDQRLIKIKSLKWNVRDPDIKITILNTINVFEIDPNALLSLEVEIFSQVEAKVKTTITQFSYIDTESKNKVFEFSRMFVTFDKKKPD